MDQAAFVRHTDPPAGTRANIVPPRPWWLTDLRLVGKTKDPRTRAARLLDSAGSPQIRRRKNLPNASIRQTGTVEKCERRDLNPQPFWGPDPKSGAYANSATLAIQGV